MRKKNIQVLFSLLLLLTGLGCLWAESFRVKKTHCINLDAQTKSQKVSMGFTDALSITISQDRTFIQGLELDIKLPQSMLEFKNTIAYSLYKNIQPLPDANTIDFSGERMMIDTFPGRLSLILQIPLQEKHNLKPSPYIVLLSDLDEKTPKSLFLRLQPVMKGLPENIENIFFEVDVKPLLINAGLLKMNFTYPSDEKNPLIISIDEKPIKDANQPILLSTGMHHISIVSEHYRSEVRSITIEQARTAKLDIQLQDIIPTLIITAPENSQIFLDGQEIAVGKKPLPIQPGEHTIIFRLGGYEVVKTITALSGKTYTVFLTIDAQVNESP